MSTKLGLLAAVISLGLLAGHAAAASLTIGDQKATGTGPWTLYADGKATIASNEHFQGLSFYAVDANGNKLLGFLSLPNGNPKSDGVAVPWEGTVSTNLAGTYTLTISMQYLDANLQPHTITMTAKVTTP